MLNAVDYLFPLQPYIAFRLWRFSSVKVSTAQISLCSKVLRSVIFSHGSGNCRYLALQSRLLTANSTFCLLPSILKLNAKACSAGKMSSGIFYCSVCPCSIIQQMDLLFHQIFFEKDGCFSFWMPSTWCTISTQSTSLFLYQIFL